LDGNFIGMNFYGLEETPYIPMNIILKLLGNFDAQGYGFHIYVEFCTVCVFHVHNIEA
jgi:hypothetical protein